MGINLIFLLVSFALLILLVFFLIRKRKVQNSPQAEKWLQLLRHAEIKAELSQSEPEQKTEDKDSKEESENGQPESETELETETEQSDLKQFQDEQIRLLQLVWGKDAADYQPVYENFVEGRFSHLFAIAIQGVITSNTPSSTAIEAALGTKNNYHQSAKYLDYMIDAGVIIKKQNGDREIAITPGQARCIILPKLMRYPDDLSVSEVIARLKADNDLRGSSKLVQQSKVPS